MAPTLSTIGSDAEPSRVNELVITKGFGVKGLSESGLARLPPQYIQPLHERISFSGEVLPEESIPVIDMADWDNSKATDAVCDAAEKWGFFQIVNHGVPLQVLESVQAATRRFFKLAAEEKNKFSRENSTSNSVRYGTSFTPQAETALEWKDYLSLFYVSDDEASALWPPAVKDEVLDYMKQSETVIKRLLLALMQRLNVTDIDDRENLLMGSQRINLNYYPVCPDPELAVGVGRHSDVSTLTVLLQDDTGGLYVRAEHEDRWIHVRPIKGSLVINVGDALQIMSNGRYRSIEHRVAANRSSDRISVPIFVNPRPSDTIFPFPEVLADGQEAIYKRVLYSDYVKHFFRKAHDGKRTVDFAKI